MTARPAPRLAPGRRAVARALASRVVASRVVASLAAALLAGCSVLESRPLEPSLFPVSAAAPAAREPVQVMVTMGDPAQRYTSPALRFRAARVELPIGAIVEAAAQIALAEQFASVVPVAGPEPGLRLQVSNVVPQHTSRLVYIVPVPGGVIDRVDVTSRLSFTLAVLGPDGRVRWSRDCDSGVQLIQFKGNRLFDPEPMATAMQRTLHEQAVGLMRLAAADLRAWLAQERLRDRVL